MRSYLFILVLIIFTSFHHPTRAHSRNAERNKGASDMHDEWACLLDEIQEPSFAIPLEVNSDEAQSNNEVSTCSMGERLQQRLDVLSEEATQIIRSFETMINSSVALGIIFHDILESAESPDIGRSPPNIAPFIPYLQIVAKLVATARDDFRAHFPMPETAPGHADRVKRVSEALDRLQRLVVRFARRDMERESIEHSLTHIKLFLRDVGVLIGDAAELYPAAVEALVLNLSTVLLPPEALFLRSLVILYRFGPYVLGKDAISGWLLKHVSDTLRV